MSLQEKMLQALEEGRLADRLWDLWGRTEQNAARTRVIKIATKELEAVLVEQAVNEDEPYHVTDGGVDLPPNKTFGKLTAALHHDPLFVFRNNGADVNCS